MVAYSLDAVDHAREAFGVDLDYTLESLRASTRSFNCSTTISNAASAQAKATQRTKRSTCSRRNAAATSI
jgi:hypothetical protein